MIFELFDPSAWRGLEGVEGWELAVEVADVQDLPYTDGSFDPRTGRDRRRAVGGAAHPASSASAALGLIGRSTTLIT